MINNTLMQGKKHPEQIQERLSLSAQDFELTIHSAVCPGIVLLCSLRCIPGYGVVDNTINKISVT